MYKKAKIIFLILLILTLCGQTARGEVATDTDIIVAVSDESKEVDEFIEEVDELTEEELEELMEDDEVADIDNLECYDSRRIELVILKHPEFIGDEAIIEAVLIDYPPGDIALVEWEYSEDNEEWFKIEDANELIYKFIVTRENLHYWYRVIVTYSISNI